jgi:adenine-specific DNA glycosylase
MAAKTIRAKKTCCKDDPRCKRCPVVLKRLAAAGHAEREDRRSYTLADKPPKKALKAARAR